MESVFFMHLGFLNLGSTEIIIVLVIAVLLFGGRLPDIARTVGKVFFDLKRNVRDLQDEIYKQDYTPPRSLPKPYDQYSKPDGGETDPGEDQTESVDEEPAEGSEDEASGAKKDEKGD